MQHSPYQVGVIRDAVSNDDSNNIFDASLDIVQAAKDIKESYNSPSANDVRFEDLSISSASALSYAIWHVFNKYEGSAISEEN